MALLKKQKWEIEVHKNCIHQQWKGHLSDISTATMKMSMMSLEALSISLIFLPEIKLALTAV